MRKYEKTITISRKEFELINHYLNDEPKNESACFGEDEKISKEVMFDDGVEMKIECCGVQFKENEPNTAWTQAVLYLGPLELTYTEPADEFEGEWTCYYTPDDGEENEYTVNVKVED